MSKQRVPMQQATCHSCRSDWQGVIDTKTKTVLHRCPGEWYVVDLNIKPKATDQHLHGSNDDGHKPD